MGVQAYGSAIGDIIVRAAVTNVGTYTVSWI